MRRNLALLACLLLLVAAPAQAGGSCTRNHAIRTIHRFVHAYNAGNLERLDSLFAPAGSFGFYQVWVERMRPLADDRSTLLPYFQERHEHGDRLSLHRLVVNDEIDPQNRFGFSFYLSRTTDDPVPTAAGHYEGKGSADCRVLYAWNMGITF